MCERKRDRAGRLYGFHSGAAWPASEAFDAGRAGVRDTDHGRGGGPLCGRCRISAVLYDEEDHLRSGAACRGGKSAGRQTGDFKGGRPLPVPSGAGAGISGICGLPASEKGMGQRD